MQNKSIDNNYSYYMWRLIHNFFYHVYVQVMWSMLTVLTIQKAASSWCRFYRLHILVAYNTQST